MTQYQTLNYLVSISLATPFMWAAQEIETTEIRLWVIIFKKLNIAIGLNQLSLRSARKLRLNKIQVIYLDLCGQLRPVNQKTIEKVDWETRRRWDSLQDFRTSMTSWRSELDLQRLIEPLGRLRTFWGKQHIQWFLKTRCRYTPFKNFQAKEALRHNHQC